MTEVVKSTNALSKPRAFHLRQEAWSGHYRHLSVHAVDGEVQLLLSDGDPADNGWSIELSTPMAKELAEQILRLAFKAEEQLDVIVGPGGNG